MAAYTSAGAAMPHGVNESNRLIVSAQVGTAMIAADTLDVALPAGVDKNLTPSLASVLEPTAANVRLANAQLSVTNHNVLTGVTRLTAAGAVPINSTVTLEYLTTPNS